VIKDEDEKVKKLERKSIMCSKSLKKFKTKNRKTINERKNNREETLRLT
jgi:hypothetical protein